MNYLQLILAFTKWKEVNQLPATAIALWYELVATCNKCGWRKEFTVPNGLLQIKAGLSRKQFDNARLLLIQKGLITYKKASKVNEAGRYSVNPLPIVQNGQREGKQEGQQEGQREGQPEEHGTGTLIKHKDKHKDKELATIVREIEIVFGRLSSPFETEKLYDFVENDGMDSEVVCEAIRRSKDYEGHKLKYILGILNDLRSKKIKDMAGMKLDDIKHQERKNQKSGANKAQKSSSKPKEIDKSSKFYNLYQI